MARTTEKRRIRERLPERVLTLIRAMTFDQLTTALSLLGQDRGPRPRSLHEAEEKILACGRSANEITATLYKVEATTPYPHCFLAALSPKTPPRRKTQLPLGLDIRVVQETPTDTGVTLTFERDIQVLDWVLDERSNVKRPEKRPLRQPAIVRVDRTASLVTINYPSFPRWLSTPQDQRLSYEDLVASVLQHLRERYDILTTPIPTRECLNRLLEAKSDRLVFKAASALPKSGRIRVASTEKNLSVEKLLANTVGPYLHEVPEARLEDAFAEANRNSSMDSMVFAWVRENVITRVDFWDDGTEFLFYWYRTEKTYAAIDSVLSLIANVSHDITVPARKDVWKKLSSAAPGHLFLPGDLIARTKLPPEEVRSIIVDAVSAGILEPVYNIEEPDTDVDDIDLAWTTDLASLSRVVTTTSGIVDGRDPSRIRIAFRRTEPRVATA